MTTTTRRYLQLAGIQLLAAFLVAGGFALRGLLDWLTTLELPIFRGGAATSCALNALFHIYCPLCGGTRAMVALLRGDLWLSLQYNPLSAYLALSFLLFDLRAICRIARRHQAPFAIPRAFFWIALILGIAVFLTRNIALVAYGLDNLGDLGPYWQK